ncbi:protocatechuate 3,4-dioxygenase subunit alpha [Mycobacterium sp. 1465703.0]|uniref:protocatechuate 3,4-dioxygenase subunit alpha n=1 Tax=Mycobacterium sp. 1465703.0 TaxID=1834078 RepID=UPI0007FD4B31|nr:protocatechuate 3,4-dioxygenase subunit alpha [Mycobacterium sp. 1465703.0]OBJ08866.1 protocatechuate 3,4-dioxygenase subunit alpha [Mycobacterium sp. 1465703.0]
MASHLLTPGQTVGPFFRYAMEFPDDNCLAMPGRPEAIRLHGGVYDGAGRPVPDALIELWQPDSAGHVMSQPGSLHRNGWTFTGWGRCATDASGNYTFTTVAPGAVIPGRPPFFALTVFARGLLDRLFTRAYLPGDGLETDPLLCDLTQERRRTLFCVAESDGYRFDIRLQGDDETTFLRFVDG